MKACMYLTGAALLLLLIDNVDHACRAVDFAWVYNWPRTTQTEGQFGPVSSRTTWGNICWGTTVLGLLGTFAMMGLYCQVIAASQQKGGKQARASRKAPAAANDLETAPILDHTR